MSTSQRAGIIAASASVPGSLVPLVQPRSALDQGLITGFTAAMTYSLTAVAHEASRGVARGLLTGTGASTSPTSATRMTLAVNLTTLGVSSAVCAVLPYREGESVGRGLARAVAQRMVATSAAGLVAASLDKLPGRSRPISVAVRSAPVIVAVGAGASGTIQHLRSRSLREGEAPSTQTDLPPLAKSIAIGALTAAGAATLASVERHTARGIGAGISRAGGSKGRSALFGHLVSFGMIGAAIYSIGLRFFHRAEKEMSTPDPALEDSPESPRVSGGTGSLVTWAPLTREARRHLSCITPVDKIAAVMGEPALDPIRVYIGLTSAPTIDERVRLALEELDRTGALDRSLLVLCSPTGSGFVNYAVSSAWEYLSRGDCVSLAMQYSSRPSWLSLDRVDDGREQNWAMWTALAKELSKRKPNQRPRIVLFGESLGAHTSQDAFLHTGTRGLRELLIERALWLGIPHTSRWALEVRDPLNPDTRPGEILEVASAGELDRLSRTVVAEARYVLISHHDDAVTLFSPSLLVEHPWWLGEDRPSAVPPQASWSTPATFLQAAVDAKNAGVMVPGEFGSSGHDYRGDAARAVRFAFDLPCTDAQLAAIEEALRQEELERVALWADR